MSLAPRLVATCLLVLCLASSAPAADLYFTSNLLISGGTARASGSTDFFQVSGSDSDASPAYGGALGLSFLLSEASTSIWGLELPAWSTRFELEGLGGRDYELRSKGGDGFFSDVRSWSLLTNTWLDIPLEPPLSRLIGRVPLLAPMSLYGGGGLGLARLDVRTTDNVSRGSSDENNFAYQVGAGLSYDFTHWATLSIGYRYLDMGEVSSQLSLVPGTPFGTHDLDLSAHEFVSALRVRFYSSPLSELIPHTWSLPGLSRDRW